MYMYIYICIYDLFYVYVLLACMYVYLVPYKGQKRGVRFPGVGVRGNCEPSNVGARTQTWVPCKYSSPLSQLSALLLLLLLCPLPALPHF